MKHSILVAGLFAALVSTSAFAGPGLLDQTPSPTVVYGDLVTVGDASMDGVLDDLSQSEAGSHR